MNTGAPAFSSARLAGSKLTTAVRGVTSTFFSPPLYWMVITLPSPMLLMSATLALVILLSGRRSQSRWPSPVPRMLSGKMCTSSATSTPSRWPTVVVPMNLPLPMSAMLALVMPMTTTLSGTLTFISSPPRALTVRMLPSTCSSVPRMRVGAWARTAVDSAVMTTAATERIMLVSGWTTSANIRRRGLFRKLDDRPQTARSDVPHHRRRDHGALPAVRGRLPADAGGENGGHRRAPARRGGRLGSRHQAPEIGVRYRSPELRARAAICASGGAPDADGTRAPGWRGAPAPERPGTTASYSLLCAESGKPRSRVARRRQAKHDAGGTSQERQTQP